MKKLGILFVLALTLGMSFVSCDKDDDGEKVIIPSIAGKWIYSKETTSVVGSDVVITEHDYEDNQSGCEKDYIEFKSGGVLNVVEYYKDDIECEEEKFTGTWSQNNNKLVVTEDGDTETYTIISVTADELKYKEVYVYNGVSYVITYFFTKG